MTDITIKVRQHYNATGLIDRVKAALETIAPEDQPLTVSQLAPVDHFHTRGILGTAELADAAELSPSMRVLDLGCGIGGPARYFAANFGCTVVGVGPPFGADVINAQAAAVQTVVLDGLGLGFLTHAPKTPAGA